MENFEKTHYTYKEILLAMREKVLKNEKLLKELRDLIAIEKNAGSYHFNENLRPGYEFQIRLVIDEIEKRQSLLKEFFNKLTDYKFARASIRKFHMYNVDNNENGYVLKLVYNTLEEDYFGKIDIVDIERFTSIINELNNSKLSKINNRGIHVDENLYLELSDAIAIVSGKNVIHYAKGIDGLRMKLVDKSFEEMLNTNVSSSVLPEEVISIINDSSYTDASIDSQLIESKDYNYYSFNEDGQKLVLSKNIKK